MSGDMSACVCVDIGPALVQPDPQTVFFFFLLLLFLFSPPDVLGMAASVTIEKVHDFGGIASHPVSDGANLACSLSSEISCFHWMLLT